MADDLPEISQDLDTTLPQVPPDSALVPYRTARRLPGQAPIVTTGYGPRAQRQPLMPPSGAPGIPDTSQMMRTAFEHLPVDQALKVINAVQQSMGQRLFAKAVQSGVPMPQAFATYGRMMFAGQNMGTSGFTGPPQMTPYQRQEIVLRNQELGLRRAAVQAAARKEARLAKPTVTTTEETPAVEGQPAIPATTTGIWPFRKTIPAVPAVVGRPKKVVRTTTRGGEEEATKEESPPEESPATETTPEVSSTPVAPVTTPPTVRTIPKVGEVVSGHRFKGGNPNDKANWEKVE